MPKIPPHPTLIGPTPVLGSERYHFQSLKVGGTFLIDIAMPSMPAPDGRKPGLLIVPDGNQCFSAAAGLARGMGMEPGGPPPLCIVGISYEVSGRGEKAEHHKIRHRDLTPCADEAYEAMMRAAPPPFKWEDNIKTGGAAQFRDMIRDELLPWLAESFDVNADERTIAGISLGGLFVLDTLLQAPDLFDRYIAISPSVWWADKYVLKQIDKANWPGRPKALHLSVGSGEEAQDPNAKMVSNMQAFVDALQDKKPGQLSVASEVVEGETHMSIFSPGLSRGLRHHFRQT
ncbi:alpha/beta hydrolase [Maritalea mediterranea]|uniref:Prolyl oligopeptidase family serine peptidase n=1 Tax=Maritalea mediterranea TaxID=2909667 RepID=A0ABS9E5T5_9HYPH|nr:alpha/beta hydrolase-fold protein [Maritalea mediterranea]MCF4098143.1 prolyl oligopeptidase family serine peptidase [Maritalea mediterranea]